MNFNVFHAAASCGLSRVVWASSETTLGLPFTATNGLPPRYARWTKITTRYDLDVRTVEGRERDDRPSHLAVVGDAVRSASLLQHHGSRRLPSVPLDVGGSTLAQVEPVGLRRRSRRRERLPPIPDGALGGARGSPGLIIAAADTVMNRPSAALFGEVFPGVPLTRDIGEFETLLAIDRAREVIGYEPRHSWRDHISSPDCSRCDVTGSSPSTRSIDPWPSSSDK